MTDLDIEDAPELRALREMRADVEGPTQDERCAAQERWQLASVTPAPPPRRHGRAALLVSVAAAAALAAALAAIPALTRDEGAAPATTGTTGTSTRTTSAAPTPYATGRMWRAQDAKEATRIAEYRSERVERLPDGRVRIDVSLKGLDLGTLTRATNAEAIPVRFWGDDGETGDWRTERAWKIDPARGLVINEYEDESAAAYPRSRITAEHVDGPGSELEYLTFDSVPTEPVLILLVTNW
ncbi:hypothetical protein M3697_11835 [Janibacter melonis]|uniref:hypothetical protein n=1 Tax=Janibacter melonis TaxID=262209 RepID=UPI002043E634|nr:hypothetical protein [Janibacter melonis]MCM3555791.1 hypothetical protein [Janibacter melonis]